MPNVACHCNEATGQGDSPNAEIGIAYWCSTVLQLRSHLAVTTGICSIKGKGGQVWLKRPVQLFEEARMLSTR